MARLQRQRGIWTLEFKCLPGCPKHPSGGLRHHHSLRTRDGSLAEELFKDFKRKQEEDRARLTLRLPVAHPDAKRTISLATQEYFRTMAVEKSPATIKRVERPATSHLIKLLGDIPIYTVDAVKIGDYRARFLENHAPATWNSRRATLRAMWNWFLRRGWVDENPFIEVGEVPDFEDTHRLQPVAQNRLADVLSALPDRDWQLVALFLYQSLCRIGELCILRRDDVLRTEGVIRFRRPKERKHKRIRYKYIALTPELLEIITEAESRCASEYVFSRIEREGRPLKRRKVHHVLFKAGKRVGLVVSPHRLRKSGGTHALQRGSASLKTVQEIMGHSDIRTTARYLRPDLEEQRITLSGLNISRLKNVPNTVFQQEARQLVQKAQAARKQKAAAGRRHFTHADKDENTSS